MEFYLSRRHDIQSGNFVRSRNDQTQFSNFVSLQELFTCVRNDEMQFDCAESERYYELNRNIGLIKDDVGDVDGNDLDGALSLDRNHDRPESSTAKIAEIRRKLLTSTVPPLRTSPSTTTMTTTTTSTTTTPATTVAHTASFRPKYTTKRAYHTSTTPKRTSRRTTVTTVTQPPTAAAPFHTTTTEPAETLTTSTNYLTPFEEGVTTENNLIFTTDYPLIFNQNPSKADLKLDPADQDNKMATFSDANSFQTTENQFMMTSQVPLGEYTTMINEAATRIIPELFETSGPLEKLNVHNSHITDSEEAKVADEVVANIKQLQNILPTSKINIPIGMRTMRGQWNQRKRRFLFRGDAITNRRKS